MEADVALEFYLRPHHHPPPDPTEPVYLLLHGERFGPYNRSFAEGLRRCHTIKGNFASAHIEVTGEPGQRATRMNRVYRKTGTW